MVQTTNELWVLVAHRGGARVLQVTQHGKPWRLIQEIDHPEGKLQDRNLGSDEPGRGFDSHGGRHSFEAEQGPAARIAEQFAKRLAAILDDAFGHRRFARLALVAEPHFLGMLRASLKPETAAAVHVSVNKDLGHLDLHQLSAHLADVLP
jgi:protein required for attachment to host cells